MTDLLQSIRHECKNYSDVVKKPAIDPVTGESFITNWEQTVFVPFDDFLTGLQGPLGGNIPLISARNDVKSALDDLKTDTENRDYRRRFSAAVRKLYDLL